MTRPTRFISRMILFVIAVAVLAVLLHGPLIAAFQANPFLNGLIAFTLVFGIGFVFRQVLTLRPEIAWAEAQAAAEDRAAPPVSPRLLAPVAALLSERNGATLRLSAVSLRSLLDGVAARLDEGREISRYLIGLLVFLGLLGTFWGLLDTIGAISNTIRSLSVDTSDLAIMFDDLKLGLEQPLGGMATAFSSSLFGLAGSVVLGFLDLQAGQAQNRFYTDVEDWLTSITKLTAGAEAVSVPGGVAAAPDSYMTALMEQTADELAGLNRTLSRADKERDEAIGALAESVAGLADELRASRAATEKTAEAARDHRRLLEALVAQGEASDAGLDEASRTHLRNLDVGLKRLGEGQSRSADVIADTLRAEMKLLARTLARRTEAPPPTSDEEAAE